MSRNSPENLLLYLTPEDENTIREVYAALAQRGFPVQHQRPHITVTFAPVLETSVVDEARSLLPPLMPAQFHRVGTVVFGRKSKQTVAWLLETTDELEIAARKISAKNPEGRGPRWTPHLTMGLRLPRALVPDYMRALDEIAGPEHKEFRAESAAWWRPKTQRLEVFGAATE
ncbi:2'-5' RNA ligase family protein [Corynebacterium aurimucosum]|uniref:2'-5' RNA ligase n=1 Tax=Corynebacterium aurimucosum TaxID=169292 RepID=UPI00191FC1E3|nr:2'-5' RNA ligase [Corynebacterium aurimucosum]QQU96505.1 2'-5' RNA ligase [Corynebacterium aurimucosum]UTA70612.1 2'-5' RNA ligase [Corynebacterium aurimucosum]WJY71208.1 2',5' RNA ligase family [Corynebacterium aurimucosum]